MANDKENVDKKDKKDNGEGSIVLRKDGRLMASLQRNISNYQIKY